MIDWSLVRHFTKEEWGPEPDLVDPKLIFAMDLLRENIRHPIIIHESYAKTGHSPDSWHYVTNARPFSGAVDCHIRGISVVDFWLAAEKLADFGGVGIYPYWSTPGLHLDIRRARVRSRWWKDQDGSYRPLTGRDLYDFMTKHSLA